MEIGESCAYDRDLRKRRKPSLRHFYVFLIFLFSILVPPLAVFIRFGICFDFFVNILLTIAGYIPGHRVRDNSLRPDRTPKWLKRAGLVSNNQGGTGDRKWADRYINASQPVQYDDEGRPHYLYDDDDDEDAVEMSDPHALVEPDQYINSGSTRQRRALRNKASTMTMSANERIDQPYQPYEPPRSQPKNKSLKTRTMRLLGLRSSSSSRSQSNAYEDMHRRDKFVYEGDEYASDSQPSSSRMQATGDSADLDDLDRELMGLSTRTNYPPVRTNRRSAPKSVPSTLPTSNDMSEPTRDILEYEHTF